MAFNILDVIKQHKKIIRIVGLLTVCVLFLGVGAFFFNYLNDMILFSKMDNTKDMRIYFQGNEEKTEIFSLSKLNYTKFNITDENDSKILIEHNYEDVMQLKIWIEKDGQIVSEEKVSLENNLYEIDLNQYGVGEYDISLEINNGKQTSFYVSTAKVFEKIIMEYKNANYRLIQLADISIIKEGGELCIITPFTWDNRGCRFQMDGDLKFTSTEKGEMYIQNKMESDINVNHVICETPLWDYQINNLFLDFKEEYYYYINAHKVNEKVVDTTKIKISNREQLDKFLVNEEWIISDHINHVIIEGEFDLPLINVTKDIIMEFSGNISSSSKIRFTGSEILNIQIKTTNNVSSLKEAMVLDAPSATVSWDGPDAQTWDYINQYMNVKTYNGTATNTYMGGAGNSRILSGKISGADIVLDGNIIKVTDSYSNSVVLDNAIPNMSLSTDGSTKIVEQDGVYYCVVTDTNNQTYGYQIQKDSLQHQLPVVNITTKSNQKITSTTEYVNATFSIDYLGNNQYPNINSADIKIRGRGHSTWKLEKKPYKIKFEEKTSLFGLEKAKEWVLLANHLDRSLMRNTVAFEMAKIADNLLFVPSSYPVDVFVNGVYQGVYSLGEQIEVKDGRIVGTSEKDSTELDTDYLLEWGGEGDETSFGHNRITTILSQSIEIKNPKEDILTQEQYNYILDYMNETDSAVQVLSGYEEYIDIPSLIDWFLVYEFSYNVDGIFRRSDYFFKKEGGKIYAASPWDFDYAFGNFSLDSNNFSEWICLGNSKTNAYEGKYIKTNWMTYLLEDEAFQQKLKARWEEIGKKMYQTALDTIDEQEQMIKFSAKDNFITWNQCMGVKLQYESKKTLALTTYDEQVEYLRQFIKKRYNWMDKTIKSL